MRAPLQILSDCPSCRVESAFVELIDPDDRLGVALEGECRLCRHRIELGFEVREGERFTDVGGATRALARWAGEDGEPEVARFVRANFAGLDLERVCARLLAGERVETGFDVVAFLFPGAAGGSGGGTSERAIDLPEVDVVPVAADTSAPVPLRGWDPRDLGRAFASVMLADGEVHPAETRFVARALEAAGLPPLAPEDTRIWRPHELGVPPDPAATVELLVRLALADEELDPTEHRLLDEFARTWRVPLDPARFHRPAGVGAVFEFVRRLVIQ